MIVSWEDFKQRYPSPRVVMINYRKTPIITLKPTTEGIDQLNEIYEFCKTNIQNRDFIWTPSGGISTSLDCINHNCPCYEMIMTKSSGVEIVIWAKRCAWRFQIGKQGTKGMYGRMALQEFDRFCRKHNIDLRKYYLKDEAEGWAIKETIPAPPIGVYDKRFIGQDFENCHHIDFHSSYLGGLKRVYPEFAEVVDDIYQYRKTRINPHDIDKWKFILSAVHGSMQSALTNYRLSHLAKAMIEDNISRIFSLSMSLKKSGRKVIAYCADAIWYQGDIYHGPGEGKLAGEWENDHTDCRLKYLSDANYQYQENGVMHYAVRGKYSFESKYPRETWTEWNTLTELLSGYNLSGKDAIQEREIDVENDMFVLRTGS